MKKIIPGIIKIIGAINVPVLKYRLGKIPKTPKAYNHSHNKSPRLF